MRTLYSESRRVSAGGARIRGQLLGGISRAEDPVPPDLASAAEGVLDSASSLPRQLWCALCCPRSALTFVDPGGQCSPILSELLRCCQDIPQGE